MNNVQYATESGKTKSTVKPVFFQPKLTVNQPNDVHEQEADRTADHIMRMPLSSVGSGSFFKPSITAVQRKCHECEEEDKKMQRKESSTGKVQGDEQLDSYVGSLGSSGESLPAGSRQFFEPRFGRDFSGVRIHTDSLAAKSAQSINALAYTTGNNIVFNQGQYSPETSSGQKLMAHELTHVLQLGGGKLNNIQKAPADPPPVTQEVNQAATETISNAPAQYNDWNKTFHWDSKFQISYNLSSKRVTIVSRLFSVASDAVKATWKSAIEDRWGKGQFSLEAWDACDPKVFPIDVDIQWVPLPFMAHYVISPQSPGDTSGGRSGVGGTTGMTGWGTADATDVPHEYGHMLGNSEEYFTTNGVDYSAGGTKTGFRDPNAGIMNNPSNTPLPSNYESVRTGFAAMMPFPLNKVRVVPTGAYVPPMINCGGGPKNGNETAIA